MLLTKEKTKRNSSNSTTKNKRKLSNNSFIDIFKWKMDSKELKNQVKNYYTLSFLRSSRKVASLLIIFGVTITIIAKLANWLPVSWIDIIISLIIAFFVYYGKKWAIIIAMIHLTFSKIIQIIWMFNGGDLDIIMPIIWWAIFMGAFWQAYQVEKERIKQ